MDQKPCPSNHEAAVRLAEAFDRWKRLEQTAEVNPMAVPIEQLAAAWTEVEQAREEWSNSR